MADTTRYKGNQMSERDAERMREHVVRTADNWNAKGAAWRVLEEHAGTWWGDIDKDDREAVRAARETLELDALVPNTDAATDVDDGLEDELDRGMEGALDSYVTGRKRYGGEWETLEAIVVTTTGGPHVQLEYDGSDVTVHGWDWFREGETTRTLDDDGTAFVVRVFALDLLLDGDA